MPSVGFETTISAGERPQTNAFDSDATGTGGSGKGTNIFSWAKSQSQFLTMRKFSIGIMRIYFSGYLNNSVKYSTFVDTGSEARCFLNNLT